MNFIEQGLPGLKPGEALGVRPENIALRPGDGADLRLDVSLEHIEYLGACTLCHCRGYGQTIVVQLAPDLGQALAQGQKLALYVGRDKALKFVGNRRAGNGLAA
ncbi:MAG: TOBE domain-containing protein [Boseongicola sp.]|nr:TOBE domain-containing protein [Boseongicola sp.]